MKLDRLGDITSELTTSLVKSIVFPGGFLEWLSQPLTNRLRDLKQGSCGTKPAEPEVHRTGVPTGPMILAGGSPVPDEAVVAMIHLVGGRSAKVAVLPVAADDPVTSAEEGQRFFTRFGMKGLTVVDLTTRERADSPEWAAEVAGFDGVVLVGQNPARGLEVLKGTATAQVLKEMMAAGKPVLGLSAGAAILAERLLLTRDGHVVQADGLGLAPGLVVDTEFTQFARFGRLTRALQEGGQNLLGVGIDAGAAIVIRDGEAKVLGEGSVTFMDPRESTTMPDPEHRDAGSMTGLKVHVLMDGFGINLRTRRPSGPPKEQAQAVGDR